MPSKTRNKQRKQKVNIMLPGSTSSRNINLDEAINVAQQLSEAGKTNASVALLKQLVGQEKGNLAFIALIDTLLRAGWIPEACKLLKTQQPDSIGSEVAILNGICQLRLLKIKPAFEYFKIALRIDPRNYFAMHNIAMCYAAKGDREKAIRYFDQALKLEKGHIDSYLQLSRILSPAEFEHHRAFIDKALAGNTLQHNDRARFCFALAHNANKAGDIDREMALLNEGNQLILDNCGIDFARLRKSQVDAIKAFIDWSEDAARTSDPRSDIQPILICSLPRSGSSLLESVLVKNPSITATGESTTFFAALRLLAERNGLLPGQLLQAEACHQYRTEIHQCHKEILDLYSVGTKKFTDKSMNTFTDIGRILYLYPDARIIHLDRDPMDVCLSCYQHMFDGGNGNEYIYSLTETAKQILHFNQCMALWQSRYPDNILRMRYEDFVSVPVDSIQKLASFLGIDPPDILIEPSPQPVLTSSNWQVRAEINTSAIGRWRKYANHLQPAEEILEYQR